MWCLERGKFKSDLLFKVELGLSGWFGYLVVNLERWFRVFVRFVDRGSRLFLFFSFDSLFYLWIKVFRFLLLLCNWGLGYLEFCYVFWGCFEGVREFFVEEFDFG